MVLNKLIKLYDHLQSIRAYEQAVKGVAVATLHNDKSAPRFILWGSPEYNNIGDHAIAYAIKDYLSGFGKEVVEISENSILEDRMACIDYVCNNDIIVLTGGGNLGSQYLDQCIVRNAAIKMFRNNKVIVFPQSVFYEKSFYGRYCSMRDKRVFSSHKGLYLFAREQKSHELMEQIFPGCDSKLVPDIVFSLQKRSYKTRSEKVLLCLRSDVEGILSQNEKQYIFSLFPDSEQVDTCMEREFGIEERIGILEQMWGRFNESKLVITDRLHGMIFAAITGTPCVVFNNYNHKISSTLNWLNGCDFIAECNDVNDLLKLSEKVVCSENRNVDMTHNFDVLNACINNLLNEN